MDHKTFGKIVAALRKEKVSFSSGHGWIQQELADESGLTPRIIGRIERGNQARLDGELLRRLASSFDLTSLERREFFAMASEVADGDIVRKDVCSEEVFNQIWTLLEELCVPAFLTDPFSDVLGVNRVFLAFHSLSIDDFQAVKSEFGSVNNLALILGTESPLRQVLGNGWHPIALANVQQWRVTTLRYRHTYRFREILSSLSTCPEFRMLWVGYNGHERAINDCSRLRSCVYRHGVHGPVAYAVFTSTSLSSHGDLYLSAFVPQTRLTAELFQKMADENTNAIPLSCWPNPSLKDA